MPYVCCTWQLNFNPVYVKHSKFSLCCHIQNGSGSCLSSCPVGNGGPYSGGKAVRACRFYSPPSNAEVMNVLTISTPPYAFMTQWIIIHRDVSLTVGTTLAAEVHQPVIIVLLYIYIHSFYFQYPLQELHAHLNGSLSTKTLRELADLQKSLSGSDDAISNIQEAVIDHGQTRTLEE
jgi:hypothetical protein